MNPTPEPSRIEVLSVEKGFRMTAQRRAVCSALSDCVEHPDVMEIYLHAVRLDPGISQSTVYRTLHLLVELGVVARREFRGGKLRYETIATHDHGHLVDLKSGRILEFEGWSVEVHFIAAARKLGYRLAGWRLELYGLPVDG